MVDKIIIITLEKIFQSDIYRGFNPGYSKHKANALPLSHDSSNRMLHGIRYVLCGPSRCIVVLNLVFKHIYVGRICRIFFPLIVLCENDFVSYS